MKFCLHYLILIDSSRHWNCRYIDKNEQYLKRIHAHKHAYEKKSLLSVVRKFLDFVRPHCVILIDASDKEGTFVACEILEFAGECLANGLPFYFQPLSLRLIGLKFVHV